jgi:ABC-type transport system substrate-binding protein
LPTPSIKLRIDRGETDHGPVPAVAHAELGLQYGLRHSSPGRYFVNSSGTLRYLALNHERELFGKPGGGRGAGLGNVPLKKAVNFAIDRTAFIGQSGAYSASFNDQYLPPTVRGSSNAAIYPTRPDLTRARALARGNTRGGEARLYTGNRGPSVQIAQIVQANLAQIGIKVEILLTSPAFWWPGVRGEPYDILLASWRADYFDPNDYLFLLDGRTIRPASNTNVSYFNSPEYNRKLARAASLTGQARYKAFGALDVDLARNAAPLASYAVDNDRRYFSARVRRFFSHPVYGLDLAAIGVR